MLVVDPWHWLTEDGEVPEDNLPLRRQVLRVARFIESAFGLEKFQGRETLQECKKRAQGVACLGLMWIVRTDQNELHAFCPTCGSDEMVIRNWQTTRWAQGLAEPVNVEEVTRH